MGRRPNALIGEYFRRGQKLEDSSNRYQQTCTKCGEYFARGRIDGMQTHLLKRCPGLTQEDRAHIFNEMQRNSGTASEKRVRTHARSQRGGYEGDGSDVQQVVELAVTAMARQKQPQQQQQGEPTSARDLQSTFQQVQPTPDTQHGTHSYDPESFQLENQGSALHTLAEVSRRHLDFSARRSSSFNESQGTTFMRDSERALIEQTLMAAMHPQTHTTHRLDHGDVSDHLFVQQDFGHQSPMNDDKVGASQPMASLPLMQTANAANYQLEQTEAMSEMQPGSIPQLDGAFDETDQLFSQSDVNAGKNCRTMWTSEPQQPLTRRQSPPSGYPSAGFDALSAVSRNTNRARFTEDRRKEVEEVRKRGACIRCRMLKKPCSEGTPCERCGKVKVARLWNFGCLRTRLSGELNLFSTSYFHMKLGTQLTEVQDMSWERSIGWVEINLFSGSTVPLVLHVKQKTPPVSVDSTCTDENVCTFQLDEGVGLSAKIAEYCAHARTADDAISCEQDGFLKTTLRTAQQLLAAELVQEGSQKKKPHPNYIEPSVLLKQVLELWVESIVLARSANDDDIMLRLNRDISVESSGPHTVSWSENETISPVDGPSHSLIKSQLLAATENRVHHLSKSILNELERRVLQRQQVSGFASFIATTIFLNCVERVSAFYRSSDTESALHTWPLETPPSAFCNQGLQFAHLLTMLLRLRALPPKTTRTERGTLAVLQEHGLPVQRNGASTRAPVDEDTRQAALWLDPMDLNVDWLIERRDGSSVAGGGGEELWKQNDMRIISMLLLGDNM